MKQYWYIWVLAPVVLLIGALSAAWLSRAALAELAMARYCAGKDLSCTADISIPSLNRVILENGSVRSRTSSSGLKLGQADIQLSWPRLFGPQVLSVGVERPVLNISYRDDDLDLGGLDRLLPSGGSGQPPALTLEDGLVVIDTAAGVLTGKVRADGRFPQSGRFEAQFDPTRVRALTNEIVLDAGKVEGAIEDGVVSAQLDFQMSALRLGRTSATMVDFQIETRADAPNQLDWGLTAESITRRDLSLEDLTISGRATLALAEPDSSTTDSLFRRVLPLQASGATGAFRSGPYESESTAFFVAASVEGDRLPSLSAELDLFGATSPFADATDLVLTYEGELDPATFRAAGIGQLVATGISVDPERIERVQNAFSTGGPLAAHMKRFGGLLRATASDFSVRSDFRLDAENLSDWQIILSKSLTLRGENGITAILEPGVHAPVLSIAPDRLAFSGLASLTGPGAPEISMDLRQLQIDGSGLRIISGGARLEPWRVAGSSIGFGLTQLNLRLAGSMLTFSSFGEVNLDGSVLGVDLTDARLFGGVDAVRDTSGLRIQTIDEPCLGLQVASARLSDTLEIPDLAFAICPPEGRLLETKNGVSGGSFRIRDAELPLRGNRFSGDARLAGLGVMWRADESLAIDLKASQIELPMLVGGRSLSISGQAPRISVGFATQPTLTAILDSVELGGDLVPANVQLDELRFDGRFREGGLQGELAAPGILVTDRNADPLFEPLQLNASARLTGRQLAGDSPIRLANRDVTLGNARLDLDLLDLTGNLEIVSEPLQFQPRGLQPKHISDRTRGLFSNAEGQMAASASIDIVEGALSGTAEVRAKDLGFDTLRLGRVSGVNGTIAFDDLLALSTPPGQRVTIAKLEPGIPLVDGEILFQLKPDGEARLEQASWPLAGGRLIVDPTVWTLAGRRDTVTVNAVEIELSALVDVLSLPDLEAEGTVSGSFPIVFEQGDVLIRDARLVADESGGVLRYTGGAVAPAAEADPRVDAAFNALRDFRFSVLAIGLDGNLIGKMVLTVDLLGFNPNVLEGAPFKFAISIDSELVQLIEQGRRAATTEWLARAIVVNDEGRGDAE